MKLAIFFSGMFLNFFKELLQQLFLLDEQTEQNLEVTCLPSNQSRKTTVKVHWTEVSRP